jgi:integrase/recombinase XerD
LRASEWGLAPGFSGQRPGQRLTTISKALRETFKWAGVYERGKLAHTLRHSVETELLVAGVDLETVRDVLGHRDVTTTALYLHAADKRKAAGLLKLV